MDPVQVNPVQVTRRLWRLEVRLRMVSAFAEQDPRIPADRLAKEIELIRQDVSLLADGVIGFTQLEDVPATWDNTSTQAEAMAKRLGLMLDDDHPGHRESRA